MRKMLILLLLPFFLAVSLPPELAPPAPVVTEEPAPAVETAPPTAQCDAVLDKSECFLIVAWPRCERYCQPILFLCCVEEGVTICKPVER